MIKMFKIQSTPAKICLGASAFLLFIYSISFMFFSTEYVTGGDTGFALIDNGLAGMLDEDPAYGMGGIETGFNGVLFFGVFISTMLILFEGAKGKWTIMLPVILGMITMTVCIWMNWNPDSAASETPKYVSILVTLIYIGAYASLRDEGVNEGLSDFKPGLKVNDKIAMVALILLVLSGLYYSLRMIFTPDDVIAQGFPAGESWGDKIDAAEGMGVPLPTTVSVTGSMILVYTLWSALVLTDGAKGKWTIMHPSAMAFIAATVSTYVGLVAGLARTTSDANQMDVLTIPVVMLLVLISYFRLKDEGMEDGMTFMGVLEEDEGKFTNALLGLALIVGLLTMINEVLLA
tara:strand:+ start:8594 stop:9634 length:1041 start_codon:yes stop_codon:yes gene_type:complete